MRGSRLRSIAAMLAGVLAGGSLMAVAWAHGGDASLVHLCVNKAFGTLRIVAPSATCKSWERALDWGVSLDPRGSRGFGASWVFRARTEQSSSSGYASLLLSRPVRPPSQ